MTGAAWGGAEAQALTALTLATYGTVCHLCGRPGATTADHVLPRSRGGENVLANLRPAHGRCNSSRGNMPLDEWVKRHPIDVDRRAPPSRRW